MLRAFTHIGLSALLVIAPALCCCNVRLLSASAVALEPAACPSCPQPASPPPPSCCHTTKPTATASCCQETEPAAPESPVPGPAKCACCAERPDAMTPEAPPAVANPEPTGELLPFVHLGASALPIEHLGLLGGLRSLERAGVDIRFAVLYERHVLRC